MSDDLRDRIARTIARATPVNGAAARSAAEAIIDDLGLTVDRVIHTLPPEHLQGARADNPEVQEWASQQPTSARVVGRWNHERAR